MNAEKLLGMAIVVLLVLDLAFMARLLMNPGTVPTPADFQTLPTDSPATQEVCVKDHWGTTVQTSTSVDSNGNTITNPVIGGSVVCDQYVTRECSSWRKYKYLFGNRYYLGCAAY